MHCTLLPKNKVKLISQSNISVNDLYAILKFLNKTCVKIAMCPYSVQLAASGGGESCANFLFVSNAQAM